MAVSLVSISKRVKEMEIKELHKIHIPVLIVDGDFDFNNLPRGVTDKTVIIIDDLTS